MHIKVLKEQTQILYFEGEYALFRAKDEKGLYRGVINRRGDIVWNDQWRHIVMRVHGYPNIFKTHNDEPRISSRLKNVAASSSSTPTTKRSNCFDETM